MLTVAEFHGAADRHCRRALLVLLLVMSLLLGIGIIFTFIIEPKSWWPAHIHPSLLGLGLAGAYSAVLLPAVWALIRWARRDPRLVCPHCDRGLFRARCRVVGTGKCPWCNRDIISDHEPPKPPPLTRAQAEALATRYWRVIRDFLLGLPAILLLGIAQGFGCEALVDAGWMSRAVSECIASVMLVGILAWMVWMAVRVFSLPRTLVRCPRCRYEHEPRHVVRYGCCRSCSQPLIADPSPDPLAAS